MKKIWRANQMNSKIIKFRKILAEQGKEFTLEQAEKLYNSAIKLLRKSKKLSQLDLWNMQNVKIKGMTEIQKQEAIALYQHIRDLL